MPIPSAVLDQEVSWGVPAGAGLGVEVDEAKVEKYRRLYQGRGQFLPYQPSMFGREERQ